MDIVRLSIDWPPWPELLVVDELGWLIANDPRDANRDSLRLAACIDLGHADVGLHVDVIEALPLLCRCSVTHPLARSLSFPDASGILAYLMDTPLSLDFLWVCADYVPPQTGSPAVSLVADPALEVIILRLSPWALT